MISVLSKLVRKKCAKCAHVLKMLPKIESALETHLQKLYRSDIRKVSDKSQPRPNDSRNLRGKIGAVGHAIAKKDVSAMTEPSAKAFKDAAAIREEMQDELGKLARREGDEGWRR